MNNSKTLIITAVLISGLTASTAGFANIKTDAYTFTKPVKSDKNLTGLQKISKINKYVVKLTDSQLSKLTTSLGTMRLIARLDSSSKDGNKAVDPKVKLQKIIDSPSLKSRLEHNVASFLFNTTKLKSKMTDQ